MFMLVQLLCDQEGLYVKDIDFLQIVVTYANNAVKQGLENSHFEDYIKDYEFKLIDPYLSRT